MRKIYALFALICFCTLQSQAQVDVTIRVDMNGVSKFSTVRLQGNVVGGAVVDMNYIGGGIYEYVASGITVDPMFFNFRRFETNVFKDSIEQITPTKCGGVSVGGNFTSRSIPLPASDDTLLFKFEGCEIVTFENGAWSNTPQNNDYLVINDDLTTSIDYLTDGLAIDSSATLTIGSGTTLTVEGNTSTEQLVYTHNFDGDASPPFNVPGSNTNFVVTLDAAGDIDGVGQGVKVVYDGSEDLGQLYLPAIEGLPDGVYKFRLSIKASVGSFSSNIIAIEQPLGGSFEQSLDIFSINAGRWALAESQEITLTGGDNRIFILINFNGTVAGDFYVDDYELIRIDAPKENALVVNSGASLITYDSLNNELEATIKRTTSFAGGKYSFVGSPVLESTEITGTNLGPTVYSYDESIGYDANAGLSRWENAASTILETGKGYAQAFQQDISFAGIPNDGDFTLTGLTKTTTGTASAGNQGWHLLSNPYPAAISVSSFINANTSTSGAIYIWDDHGSESGRGSNSDYMTINAIGTVNAPNTSGKTFEGYVGSAQGFFVQVNNDASSVVFTEDMRVNGQNADVNFFRKSDAPLVKLSLNSANGNRHETLIAWREDATADADRGFDARALSLEGDVRLFSTIKDERYSIQAIPMNTSTSLGYSLAAEGTYELRVEELSGTGVEQAIILKDNVTGLSYDLSKETSITFESKFTIEQDRFSISFATEDQISAVSTDSQTQYTLSEGVLSLALNTDVSDVEVVVTDLQGRTVPVDYLVSGGNIEVQTTDLTGVFAIKVITSSKNWVKKFQF